MSPHTVSLVRHDFLVRYLALCSPFYFFQPVCVVHKLVFPEVVAQTALEPVKSKLSLRKTKRSKIFQMPEMYEQATHVSNSAFNLPVVLIRDP